MCKGPEAGMSFLCAKQSKEIGGESRRKQVEGDTRRVQSATVDTG